MKLAAVWQNSAQSSMSLKCAGSVCRPPFARQCWMASDRHTAAQAWQSSMHERISAESMWVIGNSFRTPSSRPECHSRSSIAFIWAISRVCDRTIPSGPKHSLRISGSRSEARLHIVSAPEWCGIIDLRKARSPTTV